MGEIARAFWKNEAAARAAAITKPRLMADVVLKTPRTTAPARAIAITENGKIRSASSPFFGPTA